MPKIKILYTYAEPEYNEYGYIRDYDFQHHSMTDWVEVTQNELNEILENKQYIDRPSGSDITIIVQAPKAKALDSISDIRSAIKEKKKKDEQAKAKRQASAKKQAEAKAEKELRRKQKQLEELKKELGE